MQTHRIYIDESGDHTYKNVSNLATRYLALTAVVVVKSHYDVAIHPALEALKRKHFSYDPDNPVILHRSDIIKQRRWFGVLQDPVRRQAWANDIIAFIQSLQAQLFTVVIDKDVHKQNFPQDAFDPYDYALAVLLWRIRGYLHLQSSQADVLAEARGKAEDRQLQSAYHKLRTAGGGSYGAAADYRQVYPDADLIIRRKDQNVAGIQIADLLAAGQKIDIAIREGAPVAVAPRPFTQQLNAAAGHMINQYGRYFLS